MGSDIVLGNENGVNATVQPNGGIKWLNWQNTRLNMYAANPLEPPLANLYLRMYDADGPNQAGFIGSVHPILGPSSGSAISESDGQLVVSGLAGYGVTYQARLVLADTKWAWAVTLTAPDDAEVTCDLVAVQDVALAPDWLVRMNEYYGAQYIDVTPLEAAEHGTALAFRQNQKFTGTNPWLVLTATDLVDSYATDLLDLAGLSLREGQLPAGLWEPKLASRRLQHEHILGALQLAPAHLLPGQSLTCAVVGLVVPDHPLATGPQDLALVTEAREWGQELVAAAPEPAEIHGTAAPATLFGPADIFAADATHLNTEGETYLELGDHGQVLSLFRGADEHLVSREKDLSILRPHGHLLRTGGKWLPEESVLTTTTAMSGLFASFLTQGHVAKDRMLSVGRGYLGHNKAAGLRIFIDLDGTWELLDHPSTYLIKPGEVQWTYQHGEYEILVTTHALTDHQQIQVEARIVRGRPARLLFALNLALDGDDGLDNYQYEREDTGPLTQLRPPAHSFLAERRPGGGLIIERTGAAAEVPLTDDAPLFRDGQSRGIPWVTIVTAPTQHAGVNLSATLVSAPDDAGDVHFWGNILGGLDFTTPDNGHHPCMTRLRHELPWLVNNALTHYLSPRGLEQYTGGGWGTRDVSQGPVEMLLALGRFAELRELLLKIFAAQGADGHWSQAFEIFPIDQVNPNGESHGDVIFWPILALGRYLEATGDGTILDEVVPFYSPSHPSVESTSPSVESTSPSVEVLETTGATASSVTIKNHLERALTRAAELVVPGTHLTAYGHGDWNDSLQPADPAMIEGMTSSWTVTLHYQALEALAAGLAAAHRPGSEQLTHDAETILAEFQRWLLPDGVIAGYGLSENPNAKTADEVAMHYLLHPQDNTTGLTYSILPMIHSIVDEMLTPEQAEKHLEIINEHLLLPDGAHLFDKPPVYRGGPMEQFQRAESASYFGREIGTMYTHAHLRYAEAMAKLGRAQDLLTALDLANPVDTHAATPIARRRQANTYFSSSDAVVPDRYIANQVWDEVRAGQVEVEGGWRVYSSGPGILLRIVVECLLGVVRRADRLVLDPVLVPGLDGLKVTVPLWGSLAEIEYRVGSRGFGPTSIVVEGTELPTTREPNRYREGGLSVARADLAPLLHDGVKIVVTVP